MRILKAPSPPRTDDDMVESPHRRRIPVPIPSGSPGCGIQPAPPEYTVQNNNFYAFPGICSPPRLDSDLVRSFGGGADASDSGSTTWRRENTSMVSSSDSTPTRGTSSATTYREERLERDQQAGYWGDQHLQNHRRHHPDDFPPSPSSHTSGSLVTMSSGSKMPALVPCTTPPSSYRMLMMDFSHSDIESSSVPMSSEMESVAALTISHSTMMMMEDSAYGNEGAIQHAEQEEDSVKPSASPPVRRYRRSVVRGLLLCLFVLIVTTAAILAVLVLPENESRPPNKASVDPASPTSSGTMGSSFSICSLPKSMQSARSGASESTEPPRVSNDFDDNKLSWGIVQNKDDPAELRHALTLQEQDLLQALQLLLAPYFVPSLPPHSRTQDHEGPPPCFPYTLAQREALLWMVRTLMETYSATVAEQDDWTVVDENDYTRDVSQFQADHEEEGGVEGKDDEGATNTSTTTSDTTTTTSWPIDQVLQPERFDDRDWLQTYVVAVVARHWNLLGDGPDLPWNETDAEWFGAWSNDYYQDSKRGSSTVSVARTSSSDTIGTRLIPESPLNLCGWQGLSCSGDGRLMSLQWNDSTLDLTGTIPNELMLLSHLVLVDLSHSPNLVGTVPSWLLGYPTKRSTAKSTQRQFLGVNALYLESTGLSGRLPEPSHTTEDDLPLRDLRISASVGVQQYGLPSDTFFRLMTQLTYLEWSLPELPDEVRTFTAGTIPTELGYLTRLSGLSLNGNGFTGTVPTEIGHLKGLENLDLSYNYLNSGPLPTEIVQLTGLQWISLQSSGLSGSLPSELVTLPDLEWLQLGGDNAFDASSVKLVFQLSPLECTCGMWTNPAFDEEAILPLPETCFCSSDNRDSDF